MTTPPTSNGYDVIGDVHGYVERLEGLLKTLGYSHTDGAWRHCERRQAIFVGDLIDRREEQQADTLRAVRSMVDAGSAQVVLGNHEFNAVAYSTVDPTRLDYCRPHTAKNRRQHWEFIDELGFDSPLHRSVIDWFRTIPLWLDLGGVRIVHACWSEQHLDHLANVLTRERTLTDQVVIDGTTKGSPTYNAIETVLKGPEIHLDGAYYYDKDGHRRDAARLMWWNPTATTLRTAAQMPGGTTLYAADDTMLEVLPDRALRADGVQPYHDAVPVIFGHYWQTGTPDILGSTTACVDYSAGKGGPLVAYQWDGETELDPQKLIAC